MSHPRGRWARVVTAGAAVLVLGSCATTGPAGEATDGAGDDRAGDPGRFTVDVDVDTPELRQLRRSAGIEPCTASEGRPVPGGMPEVTLPCLGGGDDVDLSSLRGPLVVNLWASWCAPCRDELPYYQELHERGRGAVEVLGVDYQDTQPGQALALARETGVTYPSLADPGGQLRVPFRVRGLPGLIMVDEEGDIVFQDFLAIDSYGQLAALVEEYLGVTLGAAG